MHTETRRIRFPGSQQTMQRIVKHHLLPLAGYLLLSIGFTYPAAFRLTTSIPGSGDAPWFLWQLWWFKHAIVDLRQSPLITDMIYHPLTDVPVTWQSPVNEFFTLPLQMAFGVVVLYNLLFLSSFVLSGYFMYLLVARIVRRRDLAFVGGLIFAFCAYRGVRGLGHLSLLTTQWMPLSLLLLVDCWQRPTIGRGIAAGLGLGLVALSSPYYAAYFLLPLALISGVYVLIWRRPSLRRPRLWSAGLIAVLSAGAISLLFYISFLQADPELQEVSRALAGGVYDNSADLLSWFLPPGQNPLWKPVTADLYRQFTTPNLMETTLFFGFLPVLLAITSVFLRWPERRQVIFWQMLALSTWILSFGPILHVLGRPVIGWMPYRLLIELPGFYAFRIPSRIGITAILAMTVLAMMVLGRWVEKQPSWPWKVMLVVWSCLLLLNMAFVFPYPTSSTAIPSVYHRVADTPGEFAILELPAGELFFGDMSWYMYYQTYHQKHLVSGYLGRRPARLHAVERGLPFVNRFFTNDRSRLVDYPTDEQVALQAWPEDVRRANILLSDQDIRYVILHCPTTQGSFCEPASALLTLGLGPPIYLDGTTMLFEVPPISTSFPSGLGGSVTIYDEAFSKPFVREGRYTRIVSGSGAIALSVPLRGQWSVYGELEGDMAEEVQFAIDGQVTPVRYAEYSETLRAFSLKEELEPGLHSLVIQVPGSHMTGRDQGCDSLCIRNLTARLDRPMGAETETRQTFGDVISLSSYSVHELQVSDGEDPAYVLATRWYCSDPIADDYTLYAHYVDASGERLAQDDHLLGRDLDDPILPTSQWFCPGVQYDVSYIPRELVEPGTIQVALGLWLPETGYHLQPSGELRVDEFGRTRLDIRPQEW